MTERRTEWVASRLMDEFAGADFAIDIHASNIFLREIPQVRVNITTADSLVRYAKMLDVDFVWVHQASTVLESTLAHSLNSIGVKTLVVEAGVGMQHYSRLLPTAYKRHTESDEKRGYVDRPGAPRKRSDYFLGPCGQFC